MLRYKMIKVKSIPVKCGKNSDIVVAASCGTDNSCVLVHCL